MKKLVISLVLCSITLFTNAQNESVEKSIFGVQTGILGIWVHNEVRLSNRIALRSEIGLEGGITDNNFFMVPGFSVEPKFYYNLSKRFSKSKDISGNSGNFISLNTSYHPDWFVISGSDNYDVSNQITVVPTWGMRRNIGTHFNYELGIGIGWSHKSSGEVDYYQPVEVNEVAVNLLTRIGYRF